MQIKLLLFSFTLAASTLFCSDKEFIIRHTSTPGRIDPIYYTAHTLLTAAQEEKKSFEFFHPKWRSDALSYEKALLFLQSINDVPGHQVHQTFLNMAIQTCHRQWKADHLLRSDLQDLRTQIRCGTAEVIPRPHDETYYKIALKYWRHLDADTTAMIDEPHQEVILRPKLD